MRCTELQLSRARSDFKYQLSLFIDHFMQHVSILSKTEDEKYILCLILKVKKQITFLGMIMYVAYELYVSRR